MAVKKTGDEIPDSKGIKKEYEVGYKKPPKSGQIKKGEVRNPLGRPKDFNSFRNLAVSMGQELAYYQTGERKGQPIMIKLGGKMKHVTYAELVVYSWMNDKKYMHEFRDSAYGKVPQAVDVTSGGEKINPPQIIEVVRTYVKDE